MRRVVRAWVGLLLVSAPAGCGRQNAVLGAADSPAAEYPLLTVRETDVPRTISLIGAVEARETTPVSSPITARILAVMVHEGDAVRRGQVLVRLENTQPGRSLARAEAALEDAQEEESAARKRNAQSGLNAARVQVDEAEAAVEAARAAWNRTVVTSPCNGAVAERRADPGMVAARGAVLLAIEGARGYRFAAQVDAAQAMRIHPGDPATVFLDALGPDGIPVTVTRLAPAEDASPQTEVVDLDLPSLPGLSSRMYGRVEFPEGRRSALLVPADAIVHQGVLTAVYVAGAAHVASLRYVTLGAPAGPEVEVLSGLSAGETIVDAPQSADPAGRRIEPR